MNRIASTARPDSVSDDLFPFESRFLALLPDHRMHYIDEGEGEPLVFVHGNPAWSFEFRHPVRELRPEFRCVALDHIGFGLSSRSARREDHRPQSHARRLATLPDHLDLPEITLSMTDWGGPIGLDFARKHPERVKRLVIANTWRWPVRDDFPFKSYSFLMSSWIGQYLLRQHNIFVNGVMPRAVGDRSVLTPEIMAHYRSAQPPPAAPAASAALPGYIVGATNWLRAIWQDPDAFADKPALILGPERHRVPEEGTGAMEVRTSRRRGPRVRGLRALSGGGNAGQGRGGASDLHGALVEPSERQSHAPGRRPGRGRHFPSPGLEPWSSDSPTSSPAWACASPARQQSASDAARALQHGS